MNYKELGLKTGLEFHQRLGSKHKLFCKCTPEIIEQKPYLKIKRKLRPVIGELGEVDPAAKLEFVKNKTFEYNVFKDNTCLVELDESPPEPLDLESLDIALEISLLLNADIVDELQIMRKIVIDGSNTGGFQRTSMIADNGIFNSKFGKIPIWGIFLEEEAAGIIKEQDGTKEYRLDRLGTPLVEIATGIMELEPDEVQELALELGKLLRVTGKVQRGLGTIRQDVNISIAQGTRIEAKGLQDVKMLSKLIELEVYRQINLLKLKEEFEKKGIKDTTYEIQSFTNYFTDSKNHLIKNALKRGEKVYGVVLPKFQGLIGFELCENHRFGTELAGIAKSFGLNGLIHSDEDLEKYNLISEFDKIKKEHNLKHEDAIIIIFGKSHLLTSSLSEIIKRINLILEGVPSETRKVLPDGRTQFMRYIAGFHRMYPETDVPPVFISDERIAKIKSQLPEEPEKIIQKLLDVGLNQEHADKLITSPRLNLFFELTKFKVNPVLIATTLEETLIELRRQGIDVSQITEYDFNQLFSMLEKGEIAKEAIPTILTVKVKEQKTILLAAKLFASVSEKELKEHLETIIKDRQINLVEDKKAFNILMGEMMKKFRGRADGALISKVVRERII